MNPKARFNYGYIVVVASTLIILIGFGIYYSYSVFFDPLLKEFGWTRAQTSGAFSLATLVSGALGILSETRQIYEKALHKRRGYNLTCDSY